MTEKTTAEHLTSSAPARALSPLEGEVPLPRWHQVLADHTAWRERTAGRAVEYRPDGVVIRGLSPEEARALHGLLVSVLGAALGYPLRGGVDRDGTLRVGIGE